MNNSRTDLGNLIVLARRGQLDSEQIEELDARLQEQRIHAELYRWGRAFDLEDGVQPGDETLVARAVDGALRRRHARSWSKSGNRRWRHSAWLLAAVVVGFSASALGVAGYFSWRSERTKPAVAAPSAFAPTGNTKTSVKRRPHRPGQAVSTEAAAPNEIAPVAARGPESERLSLLVSPTLGTALSAGSSEHPRNAPAPSRAATATFADDPTSLATNRDASSSLATAHDASSSLATAHDASLSLATAHDASSSPHDASPSLATAHDAPSSPHDASPSLATTHDASPATATGLFASANAARRQGATALCVQRYRELQRRFPSSPEARLSHVSLGKILQARGEAAAAVREFTEYLGQPGVLEEEALAARAGAFAQLGQAQQERESWQRLMTRFPGSVYAPRARARLAELGGP